MIDFLRFCRDYRVPYLESGHHHCKRGWVQINCPFCTDGSHGWHLGWSTSSGAFACWRCGTLKSWDVLGRLLHTTRRDVVAKVWDKYRGKTEIQQQVQTRRRKRLCLPAGSGPLLPVHCTYLAGRAFNPQRLCKDFGLVGTSYLSGAWNWRVIVPVYNEASSLVAYQGRAISEEVKPKYKMLEDGLCLEDPKSLLYAVDRVPGKSVVIVEGVTGVWRLGRGAVATFGIDWKVEQANKLRSFDKRYVLFDPEPKAQERAEQLANWLSAFPGVTEIITGFATDPGAFTDQQARRIMWRLGIGPKAEDQ